MRLATLAALLTTLIAAPVLAQNIPVKSEVALSYTYRADDFGKKTLRSVPKNQIGGSMADTLPASTVNGMVRGVQVEPLTSKV